MNVRRVTAATSVAAQNSKRSPPRLIMTGPESDSGRPPKYERERPRGARERHRPQRCDPYERMEVHLERNKRKQQPVCGEEAARDSVQHSPVKHSGSEERGDAHEAVPKNVHRVEE